MTRATRKSSATTKIIDRITAIILLGKGAKKLIAEEKKLPAAFPRDDGVRFDPNWQDDVI